MGDRRDAGAGDDDSEGPVSVVAAREIVTLRGYVADIEIKAAGQFLFNRKIPFLRVSIPEVGIDRIGPESAHFGAALTFKGGGNRERISGASREILRVDDGWIEREIGVAVGNFGSEVDAIAAANNEIRYSGYRPGKPEARSEIVAVRIDKRSGAARWCWRCPESHGRFR